MTNSFHSSTPVLDEHIDTQAILDSEDEEEYGSERTLERTLNEKSASGEFPPHTFPAKRKAKRKDDGPIEICCSWLVEHQTGTG